MAWQLCNQQPRGVRLNWHQPAAKCIRFIGVHDLDFDPAEACGAAFGVGAKQGLRVLRRPSQQAKLDKVGQCRLDRLVHRHHTGATQAKVVLQPDAGTSHLPLLCMTTQLLGQLKALRQTRGAQRVALGQQAARRVGDDLSAMGVVTGVNERSSAARRQVHRAPPWRHAR